MIASGSERIVNRPGVIEMPKTLIKMPLKDDQLKPGTPLSAIEGQWLTEMVDAEKDIGTKKRIEADFKKDSHVGRLAAYEVFKKVKRTKPDQRKMPKEK